MCYSITQKSTLWKKFLNIASEENMPNNFIPRNIKIASENVQSDGSILILPKD